MLRKYYKKFIIRRPGGVRLSISEPLNRFPDMRSFISVCLGKSIDTFVIVLSFLTLLCSTIISTGSNLHISIVVTFYMVHGLNCYGALFSALSVKPRHPVTFPFTG